MRKKIIGIVICTLMIATVLAPMAGSANISSEHISTDPYYGALNPEANFAFSKRGFNLDNWGIIEPLNLGGDKSAILQYVEKFEILPIGGPDKGFVKISDNGGSSWTTLGIVQGHITEWSANAIDISEWLDETVLIGFEFVTGDKFTSQGWSIDKIVVELDSEVIYEEIFEEYDTGDAWEDWVIKSDSHPENEPPFAPTIDGPNSGKVNQPKIFTFVTVDPDFDIVSFYIEWGDGTITDWTDFAPSGTGIYSEEHTWTEEGTFTIRAKAKDINNVEGDWSEHQIKITTPRDRQFNNLLLIRYLENLLELIIKSFPILNKVIDIPVTF